MAKIHVAMLVVILALAVAPIALAGREVDVEVPSGGVRQIPAGEGTVVDFGGEIPAEIYMIDSYAFCWDLTTTDLGEGVVEVNGTVDVLLPELWIGSGTIVGGDRGTRLLAENPLADNCASGYTDKFAYHGQTEKPGGGSGQWRSWCGNDIVGTGPWSGTFFVGSCP